jgi:hypothetical protein
MNRKYTPLVLIAPGVIMLVLLGWMGVQLLSTLRSAPASQFTLARHRWEANSILHYRMAANYSSKYSLCYYDIEVQGDRVVDIITMTCLGNSEPKTLTIDGIFRNFERYAAQKFCIPNGCSCEGRFPLNATYDQTLGYPKSITTIFHRSWLDDLLHGKFEVQECLLRMEPVVDKFEVMQITILP